MIILTKDVQKCSSCGKNHDNITFSELISPAMVGDISYPFIGQCPDTHQPIFMKDVTIIGEDEDGDGD